MKIFDKAVSNAYYMVVNWIVLTIFAFLFQLVSIKLLTQEQFGISLTATNLAVFVGNVLTLGLSIAITKLIPEYNKKNQISRIRNIISRSIIMVLFAISVFTIFFIFYLDKISEIVKVPRIALILVSISYFIIGLTLIFSSVIYGFQNMRRYFFGGLGYAITKFVVSTILILLGFSFFGPLIGLMAGFMAWLLITFTPQYITLKISSVSDKELFKYGVPGLISMFTNSLFTNAQFFLLTIIKTATITGIFGVGMLITSVITVIPNLLSLAVFPIISELSIDKKSKKTQKSLVNYTLRYSLFLTFPIIFIFSIFSGFFILLFSNPQYLGASSLIPILSVAALFLGISNTMNNAIYASRRPVVFRNISIIVSIFFLLITPFLATFKGDLGMSISFLSVTFLYLFLSFAYLQKKLKVGIPSKDLIKLIFASTISFLPLVFLNIKINSSVLMMFSIIISVFVYLFLLLLMKFYKQEDLKILQFFIKKIRVSSKIMDYIIVLAQKNN